MQHFLALFAPVALMLPLPGSDDGAPVAAEISQLDPRKAAENDKTAAPSGEHLMLDAPYAEPIQRQVRIEQRVIVRIAPRPSGARNNLMAELPQRATPRKLEERKMESCVPISGIAGVQTGSGNRLLLFLRDRRIVSANLEKACRARDFYSGFYLERNKDGMLCVDRDKLQSRSGANCEVSRMRQLVSAND